jgi:uncharacterized protein (DUF2384 family)
VKTSQDFSKESNTKILLSERDYAIIEINRRLKGLGLTQELMVQWWERPNLAFDSKTPSEVSETEDGLEKILDYLYRFYG